MASFQTRADESSSASDAKIISSTFTGYLNSVEDHDFYKLSLSPGIYQISVLPDLKQLIFPVASAAGPAFTALLTPETSFDAHIYREVIYDGASRLDLVGNLSVKPDDLAMKGRVVLGGGSINFIGGNVSIENERTETQAFTKIKIVYTGNYFLEVAGGPMPYSFDSLGNPIYSQEAGRYLVTLDNPTGLRTTNWGPWIDTIDFAGNTTDQQIEDQNPSTGIDIPDGLGKGPNIYDSNGSHAETRPLHYEESTGLWTAPAINGLPLADLSKIIGKGPEAIKTVGKSEILDFLIETATHNGFGGIANAIKDAGNVGNTVVKFADGILNSFQTAFDGFKIDTTTNAQQLSDDVDKKHNDLRRDTVEYFNKFGGATADAADKLMSSIGLAQSNSDISFKFRADPNGSGWNFDAQPGHRDWVAGTAARDVIFLGDGDDIAFGLGGNDLFEGGGGRKDLIFGGNGVDSSTYNSISSSFKISSSGDYVTVGLNVPAGSAYGNANITYLHSVERLVFFDKTIALDIDGNAGQVYRLYQAAFDRAPDTPGLTHNIRIVDGGFSLHDMASAFTVSPEFVTRYGSAPSDVTFVDALYRNVLHRGADAEGLTNWTNALANNVLDRGGVLAGFSESIENKNVVGVSISSGITLENTI